MMQFRRKTLIACVVLLGYVEASAQTTPATPAREFVTNYCVTCHNDRLKTGNLTLESADANQVFNAAQTWEKVIVKLRSRSMPPPGIRRPDNAAYDNAVRDLIGVEVDAPSMLPPDEQAHGFDTNADALLIAPALLDRYLNAAAKIARLAIGDPTIRPGFERYTTVKGNANEQTGLWQTDRLGEDFSLGSRGGIAVRHYFPVDGECIFRVRLQRTFQDVIR